MTQRRQDRHSESEAMAVLSCSDCGVNTVQPEDLICFRCGANLPHVSGADDDMLTPTILAEVHHCPRSVGEPPALGGNTPVSDAADVVCTT